MSQFQSGADPISKLITSQLSAWKQDSEILGGLLYILKYEAELQLEVHSSGETAELEPGPLKVVLLKASENTREGWNTPDGATGYSMFLSDRLVAFWLLYHDPKKDLNPSWGSWAQQFEANLSNILQSLEGETPDFSQLVSALPASLPDSDPPERGLHWESSRSKAPGRAKEDLAEKLLLDYKPLF